MGVTDKYSNINRGDKKANRDGQREWGMTVCSKIRMGGTQYRIWDGWDISKLCTINSNINTDMYNGKLRDGEKDDKTIFNIINDNRVNVNRGVYSNGYSRILCII